MIKKNITFEDAIRVLRSATAPTPRILRGLSSIDMDQLAELQTLWQTIAPNRRAIIAEKLSELAEKDVELDFTSIFRFTLTDVEESVRLASIEGLWEDESPALIDSLVILLRSDPSAVVRAAAATSLGRFVYLGEIEQINRHRRDQVYSALMGAIITNPPGSLINNRALESLSFTSNEQVEQLIKDAYASEDPGLRVSSVVAMGRSNDRHYAPLVLKQLHNVLPNMREAAARASGELEVKEAVPVLGKLIDDPETDVILAAIDALAEIGGDDAKKLLEDTTHSDDVDIAAAAQEALEEFEFMHGDIKFATEWFDDLSANGSEDEDHDGKPGAETAS
jgi:HEAT repeat protein